MLVRYCVIGHDAAFEEAKKLDAQGWRIVAIYPHGKFCDYCAGFPPADDSAWWVWVQKDDGTG